MILHDVYNTEGLLKQKFADYQIREGQVKMSELIEQAFNENRSAVIEGATGVGKGFAYLIPAIISKKNIIVSTSNKNLQDQLNKKDLPTLQEVFGFPLSWTVLKGKNNYFCREHFITNEMEIKLELLNKTTGSDKDYDEANLIMQQIAKWVEEDGVGDLDTLPFPISKKVRDLICCSSESSHEKESEAAEYCYASRARSRAKASQIILVNHTLLALDMNLKRETDGKGGFLPPVDKVIIDEAHEFEKAAVLAFSDEISIYSLLHLLNWRLVKKHLPEAKRIALLNALQSALANYLPEKGISGYYTQRKVDYFAGLDTVVAGINDVIHTLASLSNHAEEKTLLMAKEITKEAENLQERLQDLAKEDTNALRWSEAKDDKKGQPQVKLKTVPLDISYLIKDGLFGEGRTVIACSATLAVFGSFSLFKEQVGMTDALEMIIPSPFDYKQQALVYISDGSQDKFYEMEQLLKMSKGRAFVLFCSYKDMELAYKMVKTDHPKFIQTYDQPKQALLEEFKNTPNSILFATKSFWEGVDIKGDTLSLVIIDKIPFENPKDIVFSSKCAKIDEKYGMRKSFMKLYLPDACIKLKQGVGRLIRSTTDKGVIALLDPRVNYKSYGQIIISCLPDAYRTQQLENVAKFFKKLGMD